MKSDKELVLPGLRESLTRRRYELDQVEHSVQSWLREGNRLREESRRADKIYEEKRILSYRMHDEIKALERLIKEYS
jgi:hypothetical protein